MAIHIVNNRLSTTRITVFDVYYYLVHGDSHAEICRILQLSPEELQVALDFIEQNRDYVERGHQQIEERNRRGNPPEIEAKREISRARMKAWLEQRKAQKPEEANGTGPAQRH